MNGFRVMNEGYAGESCECCCATAVFAGAGTGQRMPVATGSPWVLNHLAAGAAGTIPAGSCSSVPRQGQEEVIHTICMLEVGCSDPSASGVCS